MFHSYKGIIKLIKGMRETILIVLQQGLTHIHSKEIHM